MLYGQRDFWRKSTGRVNKAYAEAVTMDGEDVIIMWDMGCARSVRDEQLHDNQFRDVYGLRSAYAMPARDAKRAMKRGTHVIVINY